MSLISAMYSGVTGIKAFSTAIQVIGNNLANLNTVGFKAARCEFGDLLSQGLTGAGGQLGRGTKVMDISKILGQGTLSTTDVATDMAIEGNGWFDLTDGVQNYYSRDGQFRMNDQGFLVNSTGLSVVGFQYDATGNPTTSTGPINLSNLITKPNPTTKVTVGANLNAESDVLAAPFDINNPVNTTNFSTSIRVYDSLGQDHEVTIFFRKTADLNWEWRALVPMSEVDPASAGYDATKTWSQGADGNLGFTATGALDVEGPGPTPTDPGFDFKGGATAAQAVSFDFGDSITTDSGTGLSGTTQFAAQNVVSFQTQDGYSAGNLVSVAIDKEGIITGLASIGNNLFQETASSGQPTLLAPGQGAAGTIASSALEQSNADVANEFVQMIQNQRAYQANTKIVTVADQLLNETVNLIR